MVWVRSKDKETLMNIQRLEITPGDFKYKYKPYKIFAFSKDFNSSVGLFPGRKAALAELDAIERWIADGAKGVYQISGG